MPLIKQSIIRQVLFFPAFSILFDRPRPPCVVSKNLVRTSERIILKSNTETLFLSKRKDCSHKLWTRIDIVALENDSF